MPRVKLTDALVRSAKAIPTKDGNIVATEFVDTAVKGLSLRVTPAGVKSWTYRYRVGGKQKRLSLGKVDNVTLADARKAAQVEIGKVASGGDPVKDKQLAKIASAESVDLRTISQVWEFYDHECELGRHRPNAKPKKNSTLELERYYFRKHIDPAFGNYDLADLRKAHIQKFVNELSRTKDKVTGRISGSDSASQRCRVILHSLYTFAQRNEIVESNPVQFVTTTAIKSRDRVLNGHEMSTVWQAMTPPIDVKGAPVSLGVAYAIKLMMVTLQRRGEVAGMRQSEIDRDKRIWTIPGSRTKNGRIHAVPLSETALELIDAAISIRTIDEDFLFPSPKKEGKPINPKAITRAVGRIRKSLELIDIRSHDMRRTGATNLTGEGLGFPRFIVSKVLNHSSDTGGAAAVTGVYDRNEYLPEKRRALDAWALRLLEIIGDEKRSNNVISIAG